MTAADLIRIENRIKSLWLQGQIPYMLHLAGGNEDQLIRIFSQMGPDDWIFTGHRSHYHALLHGMPEDELVRQIMEGRSMCLQWPRMVQSSILAGVCAMAAGMAMSIKLRGGTERVWCFLGDGGSDEGTFWEAARWVSARDLPCAFILENNQTSCGVGFSERWGRNMPWNLPDSVQVYWYEPTLPHAGTREKMTLDSARIEAARKAAN
jgi:pyruvate dehydrogenase E1 component alpha subunit